MTHLSVDLMRMRISPIDVRSRSSRQGKIIHGDGAIYQNVRFKALVFTMDNNEVIDGAVSEVSE